MRYTEKERSSHCKQLLSEDIMSDYKLQGESNVRFLRRTSPYQVGAVIKGKTAGREYRLLKLVNGRGGVYGLMEMTDTVKKHTSVLALVIAMKTNGGDVDYKVMTELDGPNMANLPAALMRELTMVDALAFTPDEVRRSTEWRAKCQKAIDNQAALKPGVKFRMTEPVKFSKGTCSEFEVENLTARIFIGNPGTPDRFRAKLSRDLVDNMDITIHP